MVNGNEFEEEEPTRPIPVETLAEVAAAWRAEIAQRSDGGAIDVA